MFTTECTKIKCNSMGPKHILPNRAMTNVSFITTGYVLQRQYNLREGIETYAPHRSKSHWHHNSQTTVVNEPYRRGPLTLGHFSLSSAEWGTWLQAVSKIKICSDKRRSFRPSTTYTWNRKSLESETATTTKKRLRKERYLWPETLR
jgi:hypothetical protein